MRTAFIAAILASLTACASAPGPQPVNQAPAKPAAAGSSAPHEDAAGSSQSAAAAPDQPQDDKVAQLKAAYDKSPNEANKKALADATFDNAQFYMYKSPLPPGQKYPKALQLYREVVKLDPSNKDAQDAVDMIESIYRSMNRPIPPA